MGEVQSLMERIEITVDASEAGVRLDIYLARKTGITRSQIQKVIIGGDVLVSGEKVSRHYKIRGGDLIVLKIPEKGKEALIPERLSVEILYCDRYVVVVDKPAGMVVYPSAGHRHGTLMNALAYRCERLASTGGPLRPGVVHRLDKDTSGVMIVALDDTAYHNLVEQFRGRLIKKRYIALIYGELREPAGEIASPIGRSASDRKKMSARVRKGKEALTKWKVLRRFGEATMIEVSLGTGRTHQIRVHFSSVGHPVIGDRLYGKKTEIGMCRIPVPRQMLHSETLGFTHPATGEYMEFRCPSPEDMEKVIRALSEIDRLVPRDPRGR
jgi:23S rRNA pseudouridine1911/1915/1917 synthase